MLDAPEGGKMFGVLVVEAPGGRVGFLRSFSATLGGRWAVAGFVPPLFDHAVRAAVETSGEATVKALLARFEALDTATEVAASRAAKAMLVEHQTELREAVRRQHEANRRQRHAQRAQLMSAAPTTSTGEALHLLDQQSRGDKAERRRLEAAQGAERESIELAHRRFERRLMALDRLRRIVSRELMKQIHDSYAVPNARGERRALRALHAPGEPPSGAADCAAPKLLAFAYGHGLRPLALAEFWWGAPPAAGGRMSGAFYAACREKCGPLLPFMLEGLTVSAPRAFAPPDVLGESLPVIFEDAWLVVVAKPCGLLSVPGRDAALTDSVLARLRRRQLNATEPMLVHRLDLDTSGLLVAAKDPRTYVALQKQFARREVQKRYVALLAGRVEAECGVIDFPMRVDLHDRPRQIHDPVHGKAAVTEWQVLERVGERTRVAFFPRTGRTHQLRVHAAHPLGLGMPIVGDRLYGHAGDRLLLHAEALAFVHPHTGERVSFECPTPF
jgi:tRNA pseudouridine32 synthase/23S rRNA pseudouridine746 synthase